VIDRVIDFSVRNKFLVLLLVAAAAVAGAVALRHVPLDAIPDLGDTQVIIYSKWDRSPDIVEAQVTYPLVTAMLGAPRVRAVRGVSDFGYSFVYVIFEDGTDPYWARTRTMEYLSGARGFSDGTRARRDGARLGLPVRARGPFGSPQPGRPAVISGLAPALLLEGGAGRVGSQLARRLWPAVSGERGPEPAAQLRPVDPAGG
jgi:AcrB/AcrD/AcrF family